MDWMIDSSLPIYAQLAEQLRMRIVTGTYSPGARMPAVRELALEAGVNPNTMQRALAELERRGLVFSQRTSGRFVTEDTEMIEQEKRALAEKRIREFLLGMERLGFTGSEIMELLKTAGEEEAVL